MIGEYLEAYTYENILASALERVPDTIDKREGSIIFDALAPACYELAEFYMNLKQFYDNVFIGTAHNEYLDLKVAERGLARTPASRAIRLGKFYDSGGYPMTVPIGSRFSSISDTEVVVFEVLGSVSTAVSDGMQLRAETSGAIGNSYVGNLLPIDYINNLETATLTDILVPGGDAESDESLREKYFESLVQVPTGGNLAQYREILMEIEGVGGVQIYPAWKGGGTVKIFIVDALFEPASSTLLTNVKNILDPEINGNDGTGGGLVPIGHHVTTDAPLLEACNVYADVTFLPGYTYEDIHTSGTEALVEYFMTLRHEWATPSYLNTYDNVIKVGEITTILNNVEGVNNATVTNINFGMGGTYGAEDVEWTDTAEYSRLPRFHYFSINGYGVG